MKRSKIQVSLPGGMSGCRNILGGLPRKALPRGRVSVHTPSTAGTWHTPSTTAGTWQRQLQQEHQDFSD